MPVICAVAECKNSSKLKTKKAEETGIHLIHHRFPCKDEVICSQWINLCKRLDKFNPRTSYICSEHFEANSYQRDLEHELLNLPLRRRLRPDAVPTIFPSRQQKRDNPERETRVANRRKKQMITELLDLPTPQEKPLQADKIVDDKKLKLEDAVANLTEKVRTKKEKISKLRDQIKKLRIQLKNQRQKCPASKLEKKAVSILTKSQIKRLRLNRRVNWSAQDIVAALSVRSSNLGAYQTAKQSWKLPLPSVRTLQRWTQKFSCVPGILKDVLEIMKSESHKLELRKRVCVISFDEMSINSKFVIDRATKQIVSSSKVQVVLARGVFDAWKQPIYYAFDTAMTQAVLEEIISAMENAGFPVHAICSDLGPDNRSLWSSLNIDIGSSTFPNPICKERKIHVFADVPHMMKLLRNHVLDDGLLLENNCVINKQKFVELVKSDDTVVKLCPKLNMKLLEVTGPERMRVRPAVQLFSHHVGTLATKTWKDAPEIAEFIFSVNNGFDVLNSRVPHDKNVLKSGFGIILKDQLAALQNLRELMLTSRFYLKSSGKPKGVLLPFQKGLIISIDSTIGLWEDLKRLYNVDYLLTSRLNQDALESLFSRLRAFGGPNTNPTPPEFKYRLRLLLLGSKVRAPSGSNTNDEFDNNNWISAQLLQMNAFRNTEVSKPLTLSKSSVSPSHQSTDDAVKYLAGYLAFKLRKKGLEFGSPTNNRNGKSWIHMLSKGGLILPTNMFFRWIKKCNTFFEANLEVLKNEHSYHIMVDAIIKKHPEIRQEVVKAFINTRMNIQVNSMNAVSGRRLVNVRKKLKRIAGSSKKVM